MEHTNNICVESLIEAAEIEIIKLGYRRSRVGVYTKEFREFREYCSNNHIIVFSSELSQRYFLEKHDVDIENLRAKLTPKQLNTRCALRMLDDLHIFGNVRRNLPKQYQLPQRYKTVVNDYTTYCKKQGCSTGTISVKMQKLRDYISFLQQRDIEFSDITPKSISEYIITLTGYKRATLHVITSTLSHFSKYIFENGITEVDLSCSIPKPKIYSEESIPMTWKADEVDKLLGSIDRGSPIGKRDYAMIIIALMLGIRVGDICTLKFDNLNWNTRLITYIQQKTKKINTLPILPEIGDAIIDYIKNGRIETTSNNIFVRHIYPYTEFLSSSVMSASIKRYMRMAGLKVENRKVMHSLRHTLASTLLKDETPFMTISNVLGHETPATTNVYTKVDIQSLKKCTLSFSLEVQ